MHNIASPDCQNQFLAAVEFGETSVLPKSLTTKTRPEETARKGIGCSKGCSKDPAGMQFAREVRDRENLDLAAGGHVPHGAFPLPLPIR
jgi:hypothetical protein